MEQQRFILYLRRRLGFGMYTSSLSKKSIDNTIHLVLRSPILKFTWIGGDLLGSVVKKRRKKMRKHKHRKLLAKTRHQRRKK